MEMELQQVKRALQKFENKSAEIHNIIADKNDINSISQDLPKSGEKYLDIPRMRLSDNEKMDNFVVNGKLVSTSGIPVKVILLVGSTARSGTSFIAELLSQQNDTLYLFEPTHFIKYMTGQKVQEQHGISHTLDMIHCRITDLFLTWLKGRGSAMGHFRHPSLTQYAKLSNWKYYLSIPLLTHLCQSSHVRVIKVIRLRMSWLRRLLDDPLLNVKIIHLARDPRASLYSMSKNGLEKADPFYYCPRILEDLQYTPFLMKRYPGRVMTMGYEKFCINSRGEAQNIWRFLTGNDSADIPQAWSRYLALHTIEQGAKTGTFSTFRNTLREYSEWRKEITEYNLLQIERCCQYSIRLLGLNLFGSIKNARDMSKPLLR
ncbi:hypothetical protein SK128_015239 [Halocaridina rubra]|uniref:Sulfotransferase domain-containing protein n=1 Tax=Halocaridina rubra TaxID=373956 RepID=A0AAN8WG55_HALRR